MWNAKPPASKCHAGLLASELLAMIFREVAALHERDPIVLLPTSIERLPMENELDTRPMHALSHVCRYWREVALGNPALWSRIHGRRHEQLELFLRRSQPVSVTLFLSLAHWGDSELEGPAPPRIASVITTHGARLARLDLAMIPSREHVVPLLTSLKAPRLQTLTITSPYNIMSNEDDTMSHEPLLDGEVSFLKALALMPVLNWLPSSNQFSGLTHLSISFHRATTLYHPCHLLELLSNCPALAFLHVDYLRDDVLYSGDWQHPSDPIPLPHLRSMFITHCLYVLLHAVLSHLLLPEDVFIRIQDVYDFEVDSPVSLPPLALRPVTSLDVSIRQKQIFFVADGPESGFWIEGTHAPGYWQALEPSGNWESWLLRLPESIPLTHVTHLHIHIAGGQTFWSGFLANLPQVTHLSVLLDGAEPNPYDFDAAGGQPSPTRILCVILAACRPPAPILCPALRKLQVEWKQDSVLDGDSIFPMLASIISSRRDAGYPIHHVTSQASRSVALPKLPDGAGVDAVEPDGPARDIFSYIRSHFSETDGTWYDIVQPRGEGEKGVCAFVMRDVWRVEGENRYWDVDEDDKPRYVLPTWMI